MKNIFATSALAASILCANLAQANTSSSPFVDVPEYSAITKKLELLLPTKGTYVGLDENGKKCTLEVKSVYEVNIKGENFVNTEKRFDCLAHSEIACFEFADSQYLPVKSLFESGRLFKAKILGEIPNKYINLSSNRRLGGNGEHKIEIFKDDEGNTSVRISESHEDETRAQSCKVKI